MRVLALLLGAVLVLGFVRLRGGDRPATGPSGPPAPSARPTAPTPSPRPDPAAPDARAPRTGAGDEASLRRSFESAADPEALARALIDELARDELVLALAALTGQRLEDLEEVRDLRAFAHELVGVAAAGLLREPIADAPASIAFGQRLATALERAEQGGGGAVPGTAPRVFGVFPLEEAAPQRVFVKWYRADVPALLSFHELPVRSRDGTGFVRLDRPEGWPPGDYRLEIYTGGEGPRLLASGGFRATTGGRRLVARFPDG